MVAELIENARPEGAVQPGGEADAGAGADGGS